MFKVFVVANVLLTTPQPLCVWCMYMPEGVWEFVCHHWKASTEAETKWITSVSVTHPVLAE